MVGAIWWVPCTRDNAFVAKHRVHGTNHHWVPKGSIISTFQAYSCNSGGPILNSNGEIIGITHTSLLNNGAGLTLGITIKKVFSLIPPDLVSKLKQLNDKCDVIPMIDHI